MISHTMLRFYSVLDECRTISQGFATRKALFIRSYCIDVSFLDNPNGVFLDIVFCRGAQRSVWVDRGYYRGFPRDRTYPSAACPIPCYCLQFFVSVGRRLSFSHMRSLSSRSNQKFSSLGCPSYCKPFPCLKVQLVDPLLKHRPSPRRRFLPLCRHSLSLPFLVV